MNKVHRLIWSNVRNAWIVAPENANSRGKPASSPTTKLAAALSLALIAQTAYAAPPVPGALPTGGQVVAGQAAISQAGSAMTIQQGSDRAILNWNNFSIGSGASVNFQQPSASAVALNRVVGADPSAIYGSLTANGQVFLINPNGVLFGQGARVDVGGLVASTLNIRNEDFLAGHNRFTRGGATGGVVNQGELIGKYIALLAPEVQNEGVIAAHQGTVTLAAGEAVTLGITGNALIDVQVDKASINTLVENKQMVQADAGTVIMSAQSANQLLGQVVNSGMVEANGITADGGVIRLRASSNIANTGSLSADAGTNGKGGSITAIADLTNSNSLTTVDGTLSAKGGSQSGNGGFIETSGTHLRIADSARIDTSAANGKAGTWLLDPYDFTIAASGGDITGTALATALGSNSVTIQTLNGSVACTNATCGTGTVAGSGDIFVNDSVSWNAATTLTLSAWRNIQIKAPITVSHANGGLALEFAQSDAAGNFPVGDYYVNAPVNLAASTTGFSAKYGSDGATTAYTVITNNAGVAAINSGMAGNYVLGSDVALTTVPWAPLGNAAGNIGVATDFTGILDGLGHKITNLQFANNANQTGVGLFGSIGPAGRVQNLGVVTGGAGIAGLGSVGVLAGASSGWLYNVYTQGIVTGSDTAANANPVGSIGGLVGYNAGPIISSYSSAAVSAAGAAAGTQAVGQGADGGIGGLVGWNDGSIDNSYATGAVTGAMDVGGLAGLSLGSIATSYSTGAVTGGADGNAAGPANVGGLVGALGPFPAPLLFDTFWDTTTSTQASSANDAWNVLGTDTTGLATAAAQTQANYTNFDFTNAWVMYDGISYPLLRSMLTPFVVSAADKSKTYDGQTFAGAYTASYSMATPAAVNVAGLTYGGTAAAGTNAGSYTITPSGVVLTNNAAKQDQHGYYVKFVDGTLTIDKAALTVTASNASKTYGDTPTLTAFTSSGLQNSETIGSVTLTSAGTAAAATVAGSPYAIVPSAATGGTFSAANYTITYIDGVLTVDPVAATIVALAGTKVYDGTSSFSTGQLGISNVVSGDTVSLSAGTASTADANVGTNKPFTSFSNLALTGAQAGNYTVAGVSGSGTITPKALTMSGLSVAASKVYDGTTAATVLGAAALQAAEAVGAGTTADGMPYTGDMVSITGTATGTYNSKNVATASAVSYGGLSLTGAQAGNYTLTMQADSLATITKKTITASFSAPVSKVYDGTTTIPADIQLVLEGFVSGETLTPIGAYNQDGFALLGTYSGKDVGTGLTVTQPLSGWLAIFGSTGDTANYNLPASITAAGEITPRTVTLSASKIYDGTTALTGTQVAIGNLADGETLNYTGTTASSANVAGPDSDIATADNYISAITLADGAGGVTSNYQLPALNATNAPVSITPRPITGQLVDTISKDYDSTANATIALNNLEYDITGYVPGEMARVTGTSWQSGTFVNASDQADGNVGTGKKVIVNINPAEYVPWDCAANPFSGCTATNINNYTFPTTLSGNVGSILPVALTVSGITASNKVYDGTTAAAVNTTNASYTGLIAGDDVAVTVTGVFDDKNAAIGKTVWLTSGYTGADVGNYTITGQPSTTAEITKLPLVVTGLTATNKTYDGTTAATLRGSAVVTTPITGDDVFVSGTPGATFADAAVGTGKSVTVSSAVMGGRDGSNYSVVLSMPLSADITPAQVRITNVDQVAALLAYWAGSEGTGYGEVAGIGMVAGGGVAVKTRYKSFTIGATEMRNAGDWARLGEALSGIVWDETNGGRWLYAAWIEGAIQQGCPHCVFSVGAVYEYLGRGMNVPR